jgi:hypothetical protein
MAYYDLQPAERAALSSKIVEQILSDLQRKTLNHFISIFSDHDTYIRKAGYLAIGKIYKEGSHALAPVIKALSKLFEHEHYHVRQTVVNAAGEIGKTNFESVQSFFDKGLFDAHHTVRNAVIGSVKKMGEKNPIPVLEWAQEYLHHPDKEIRREICHGIELRGRTHPATIAQTTI